MGRAQHFYKISLVHLSTMFFLRKQRLFIDKLFLSIMLTFLSNVSRIQDLSYGIIYQTILRICDKFKTICGSILF